MQGNFFIQSCNVIFHFHTTNPYRENPYVVQKVGSMKVKYTTTWRIQTIKKSNTCATFKITLSPSYTSRTCTAETRFSFQPQTAQVLLDLSSRKVCNHSHAVTSTFEIIPSGRQRYARCTGQTGVQTRSQDGGGNKASLSPAGSGGRAHATEITTETIYIRLY